MLDQRTRWVLLAVVLLLGLRLMACSSVDTTFRNVATELAPTEDGQPAGTAERSTATTSPSRTAARREVSVEPSRTTRPASPIPSASRSGHIADLLAEGAIALEAQGAGIEHVELDVQNRLEEAVQVQIPAGTYFVSAAESVQDMAVRSSVAPVVQPGEVLFVELDAVCAQLSKDVPVEGDGFTAVLRPPPGLEQLMAVLDQPDPGYDVQQAAVWIVTDDADWEALGRLASGLVGGPTSRAIGEADVARAMELVQQAGIDVTQRSIWGQWDRFAAYVTPGTLPMPSSRSGSIVELVDEGVITVEATGSSDGVLDLAVENLSDDLVHVEIPAGTTFLSHGGGEAKMLALGTQVARVKPGARTELSISAASTDMSKRAPRRDALSVEPLADEALAQLVAALGEGSSASAYAQQAAVWIVTDDANYDELSAHMVTREQSGQFDRLDAAEAMRLVDEAGLHITSRAIWQDRGEIAESIKGRDEQLARWLLLHQPGGGDTAVGTPAVAGGEPEPAAGTVTAFPLPSGNSVDMVYVPAGPFPMGSGVGRDDQQPVHEVVVDGFWIDRTEVTNGQFAVFTADTGYVTSAEQREGGAHVTADGEWEVAPDVDWEHPQGGGSDLAGLEEHPVVQVSWEDATAYCTWREARLPTEAEWEKAGRGTDLRDFPWDEGDGTNPRRFGEYMNLCDQSCVWDWADQWADDGYALTAPVGSYPPGASPYGALDMAGNVWEWTADWYDESTYQRSPGDNPTGPSDGEWRALRGGSFATGRDVDIVFRSYNAPWAARFDLGFRCAKTP